MGFFSKVIGIAAPIVGGVLGGPAGAALGSAIGGAVSGGGKSGGGGAAQSTQQTTQQQLDPRAQNIIYGDGTDANKGLLAQYQALGQAPQNAGTSAFGNASAGWLGGQGSTILGQLQNSATNMMNSSIGAPQSTAASAGDPRTYNTTNAQAAQVSAPSQNGLDLTKSYNDIIYGDPGANPYLTKSLQAGVDLTNAGFQKNVNTLTDSLQRNVLPGIRSNSVLAGQYGSSRQGIAEGNALSDYTRQLTDANSVLAAQNSANTTGAQAASYNAGKDRALAATQSLGGQQYGVAQQNAAMQQQTSLANTGAQNAASAQNANAYNNQNQFNAGLQQQTGLANQSAQLQTNGLNSANQQAGTGALSGLLNNTYNYAQNQDNYAINKAQQVNGLLSPYLGMGGTTTSNGSQQMPNNTGANILGGAAAGLGLFNGVKNSGLLDSFGFGGSSTPGAQNIVPWSG